MPLEGVRVLDVTHVGAGPLAGSILGQLGAQVVKVEPLGAGELVRKTSPTIGTTDISYYFASVNSQKRFVQLDLKSPAGSDIFKQLAAVSDIVLTNMGPGAMARLGLAADDLRALNERLIYCQITGFRPGSAYDGLPSFDYVHEAMAGIMDITREPGKAPPLPGLPAADMSGGIYAAMSIILALRQRDASGAGQAITVPLHDCLLSLMPLRLGYSFATHEPLAPYGRFQRDFVPFGVFDTSDGQLVLAVGSQPLWRRLVEVIPEIDEPIYDSPEGRVQNSESLLPRLVEILQKETTSTWTKLFAEAKVPAGPVLDTRQVVEDDYIRGMTTTMGHEGGSFTWLKYPVMHSAFEPQITRPTTLPGAHTTEILREMLDFTPEECARLVGEGVING